MKNVILIICMVLALSSCAKHPQPFGPDAYELPVKFDTAELYLPMNWDQDETVVFDIPPSDKPRKLAVRPKPHSLKNKLLPAKNQQRFESVSDDPGIKQKEATNRPWWYWGILCLLALSILAGVLTVLKSLIPGFDLVSKIFRLFKKG